MAGIVKGKIECYHAPVGPPWSNRDLPQGVFTTLYKFFSAHPNMTEIARHGGVGSSALNVNYWDQLNPFTNNAWFVFRMNTIAENPSYQGTRTFPWYVLVQWCRNDQGNFGAAPGNPGLVDGQVSTFSEGQVAIQFAIGIGGDQNPWKGTGTLGTNVKGDPVWGAPTGGTSALVWPRSNGPGGAHDTSKQNMMTIWYGTSGSTLVSRTHCLADDDNFAFLYDWGTFNYGLTYFGLYTPRPELIVPYPMVCLGTMQSALPYPRTTIFGGALGTNRTTSSSPCNGGGVAGANPGVDGVRPVQIDRYATFQEGGSIVGSPNKNFLTNYPVDEFPISIYMSENPNYYGWLGQIDFIREVNNIEAMARKSDATRAIFGPLTVNTTKISAPWAPAANMGHGMFREGITF